MEWTQALKEAIAYIEDHLESDCSVEKVANAVHISPFYFQKAFKMITGYTIGEYVRNRRLYLAALALVQSDVKVIDLAFRFGYDTPESFTKAFGRFHGLSPIQLRETPYMLKPYLPLRVQISIIGGDQLDVRIEKLPAFSVMGMERRFSYEKAFDEIPIFWQEWRQKWSQSLPIGKYGVSVEDETIGKEFSYLIAGDYVADIKVDMSEWNITEIPAFQWAKFRCIGPMPEALQALNRRIFNEWLPNNGRYEIAAGYNIELYSMGDTSDTNYESEIWIPVSKRQELVGQRTNKSPK
ncbi:MAG: AraC family transcriptional regulator [Clostridiales bacterium]|nr:AraC family transcriptional regulator [Clostridiales bacterium]